MSEIPQAPTAGARRRRALSVVMVVFLLIGIGWIAWWYFESPGHETTDNAYVGGDLVEVTPQVPGTVVAIGADDTDLVEAGQSLVQLDTADAKVALAQAEATRVSDQAAYAIAEARYRWSIGEILPPGR